jgi:hypothetical protein
MLLDDFEDIKNKAFAKMIMQVFDSQAYPRIKLQAKTRSLTVLSSEG